MTNDFVRILTEAIDSCSKKVSNLFRYICKSLSIISFKNPGFLRYTWDKPVDRSPCGKQIQTIKFQMPGGTFNLIPENLDEDVDAGYRIH